MKFILAIVLIAALLQSCKNGNDKQAVQINDSLAAVERIVSNDSLMIINDSADNWLANELSQNQISWNQFQLKEYYKNDSLEPDLVAPSEEFYKNYKSVIRWSPDSSYLVDFGSYGSVLVKDNEGNVRVEPGEPDSEVSLLQPSENLKWSLFFVGPSASIFNAKWVNKENVLILGSFDETGVGKPDTLFWLVDVKQNFYRMYNLKKSP